MTCFAGRGQRGSRSRGRGRGGRGRDSGSKTKEQLDQEMEDYFLKGDPKQAQNRLDKDLDDYFASKPTEAAAEEAAPASSS